MTVAQEETKPGIKMVSSLSAWEKLQAKYMLLCQIATCSVVGCIGPIFTAVLRRQTFYWGLADEASLRFFHAGVQKTDVVVPTDTRSGRLLGLVGGTPTYYICYAMFFPTCFFFYLDRHWFSGKAMGLAITFYFAMLFLGYGYAGNGLFLLANIAYAAFFCYAALKFSLPKDSLVSRMQIYQIGVLFLGTAFVVVVLPRFPMKTNLNRITYHCVVIPLVREITRIVATRCTWHLFCNAEVGGATSNKHQSSDLAPKINREHSWVFVGWVHCTWASYNRLAIASLSSMWLNVFVVGYQGILEIILRLTMKRRDAFISKVVNPLFCQCSKKASSKKGAIAPIAPGSLADMLNKRRNSISVVLSKTLDPGTRTESAIINSPLHNGNRKTPESKTEEKDRTKTVFYSTIILSEMCSEFMSIISAYFVTVYWIDEPLLYTFDGYRNSTSSRSLILSAFLQLLFEIIIDTICIFLERETDPFFIWALLDKRDFLFLFAFASWYGSHLSVSFFTHGESLASCIGENTTLCACVNNGFKPLGYRDSFCRSLYPNSTW